MTATTLLPPAPGPTRPHLITEWSGHGGATHRRCTCGAGTPTAGVRAQYDPVWIPAYRLADAYVAACRSAAAAAGVLEVVARLVGRRQLEPARALLAALAGSEANTPGALESPSAGPAVGPTPAASPAAPARSDTPAGDPTPEPAQALSGPRPALPAGYVRVWWACGHSAGAPVDHDWKHRHPCPDCPGGARDARCRGIRYADPRRGAPMATTRARACLTCGAPGRLYPSGSWCDQHSPARRKEPAA